MEKFPSDIYTKTVLEPAYNEAKKHLLASMIQIHIAHTKMLEQQQIITTETANTIKKAIKHVKETDYTNKQYTGNFEDLFFEVEHQMIQSEGDAVGNIHIARSRNDMGITIYRMVLRKKILALLDQLLFLKESLCQKANEHIETIMIGYTHTQQAQTTTLAHYLKAFIDKLDRDIERVNHLYAHVNQSPMGAAALTTTGFPIDRNQIAEDLAFDSLIDNSWDAVAGADYLAESASVVQIVALNIGRLAQDFLLWATQEFSGIRLSNGFVQISSIMPQKRNPVGVEHTRSLASSIVGDANTVLQMIHNTPFGDIVDTEDDLQPYLWRAFDKMTLLATMVGEYTSKMAVNKEILLERAKKSYSNITELADVLVRNENISFRQSHEVVAALIKQENKEDIRELSYLALQRIFKEKIKEDLKTSKGDFLTALCPKNFISVRKIQGSPAKEIMAQALEESTQLLTKQKRDKEEKINQVIRKEQKMNDYIS